MNHLLYKLKQRPTPTKRPTKTKKLIIKPPTINKIKQLLTHIFNLVNIRSEMQRRRITRRLLYQLRTLPDNPHDLIPSRTSPTSIDKHPTIINPYTEELNTLLIELHRLLTKRRNHLLRTHHASGTKRANRTKKTKKTKRAKQTKSRRHN